MQKVNKPNGFIIYSGPSMLDGSDIVVIYKPGSNNSKTGNMAQTYILQASTDPITANRTGLDFGICGDCPHKGKANPNKLTGLAEGRSCYVNLGQGVNQVYKAFKAGKYPTAATPQERAALGLGAFIRLGSYGDPLSAPGNVWRELLSQSKGHTGYTHQAQTLPDANVSRTMISADTEEQAKQAHDKGLRTFRVIPITTWQAKQKQSLLPNEILCPASKEAGAKVQCIDCRLCSGQTIKAKSIAIPAHGVGRKHHTVREVA